MSDRPTPRTESMIVKHSEEDDCCGAITLCRQLEREADELREALELHVRAKEERAKNGDNSPLYRELRKSAWESTRAALNTQPKKS